MKTESEGKIKSLPLCQPLSTLPLFNLPTSTCSTNQVCAPSALYSRVLPVPAPQHEQQVLTKLSLASKLQDHKLHLNIQVCHLEVPPIGAPSSPGPAELEQAMVIRHQHHRQLPLSHHHHNCLRHPCYYVQVTYRLAYEIILPYLLPLLLLAFPYVCLLIGLMRRYFCLLFALSLYLWAGRQVFVIQYIPTKDTIFISAWKPRTTRISRQR